jgi:hypothetical protein
MVMPAARTGTTKRIAPAVRRRAQEYKLLWTMTPKQRLATTHVTMILMADMHDERPLKWRLIMK